MKKRRNIIFISLLIVIALSIGVFTIGGKKHSVLSIYRNGENQVILVNYLVDNYRTKQVYEKSIFNFEAMDYNASTNELMIMAYVNNKSIINIYNIDDNILNEKKKIEIEGDQAHSMFGLNDTDCVSYVQENKVIKLNYHDNSNEIIYEGVEENDICFLRDEESLVLLEYLNDHLYDIYLIDLSTENKTKLLSKKYFLGISNNKQYISVTDENSINEYWVYDVDKLDFLEEGMMDASIVQCVPSNDLSEYVVLTSDLSNSEMKIIDDDKNILVNEGRFHYAEKIILIH